MTCCNYRRSHITKYKVKLYLFLIKDATMTADRVQLLEGENILIVLLPMFDETLFQCQPGCRNLLAHIFLL